jgi:hypothetical protein
MRYHTEIRSDARSLLGRDSPGHAMLQNSNSDVRVCREHAEWCSSQAKMAVNKQTRKEFLRLAERWSKLARGYETASSSRSQTPMDKKGR